MMQESFTNIYLKLHSPIYILYVYVYIYVFLGCYMHRKYMEKKEKSINSHLKKLKQNSIKIGARL
jgi:hypothetical protein